MLTLLDDLAEARIDLSPGRYGLLNACDGGLLEVSGLNAPVGALCQVAQGQGEPLTAEVIGFRNGRSLMLLLGDTVMLRPGARVRPGGHPGMQPVGVQRAFGRQRGHRVPDGPGVRPPHGAGQVVETNRRRSDVCHAQLRYSPTRNR